tara:strand:- start:7921 stop:8352 length:432 start_codon:yes stop_codon:yes gene_type:complete
MKIKYIKNGYDYEVWLVERRYNHERALKEFKRVNNYGGEYSKFIKPINMSDESWFHRVCQTRGEKTRLLGIIRKMNFDSSNVCWSIFTHKHTARFSDASVLEENEKQLNHTFMSYPTLNQAKDCFEDNIFEKYSAGMKLESKF